MTWWSLRKLCAVIECRQNARKENDTVTAGGYLQDPAAFHYSKAIAGSGTVGNEQTLDPFLAAPRKLFPGTSMPVSLRSAQDRAGVIAQLM